MNKHAVRRVISGVQKAVKYALCTIDRRKRRANIMLTVGFCMPNEMQLCAKMPPTHLHVRAATFRREWLATEENGRGSGSRVIF